MVRGPFAWRSMFINLFRGSFIEFERSIHDCIHNVHTYMYMYLQYRIYQLMVTVYVSGGYTCPTKDDMGRKEERTPNIERYINTYTCIYVYTVLTRKYAPFECKPPPL